MSAAGADVLDAWVLRDDRDPVADRSRPRRPPTLWDPSYRRRDQSGARPLTDDPGSAVRRSGTLSVLATALDPALPPLDPSVIVVQADERMGTGPDVQAGYSGRHYDGSCIPFRALVDDGWLDRGAAAAANGTQRRVRISGTSAAAGIEVRQLVGLGAPPEL